MKKLVVAVSLLAASSVHAGDWILLSSDESSRTLLDGDSVKQQAPGEFHFRIHRVHHVQKDMMGLGYNVTRSIYVLACRSGMMMSRQQFLLQDNDVVWTFPASDKPQKASLELPEAVLAKICSTDPGGSH